MTIIHHSSKARILVAKHLSWLSLAVLAIVLPLVGCAKTHPTKPAPTQTLTVFAATSLRKPFSLLGAQFQNDNPNVALVFNFAGTQELRTQLEQGAAADVFASADRHHMQELVMAGRVSSPTVFAHNEPVIIVSRESAHSIESLANLPTLERIVLGVPEVPIGRYSIQILERASTVYGADFRARVEAKVCSRELNVKQVLAKVAMGEAQAGIVYRSDVTHQQNGITVVTINPQFNSIAEYPIAVVSASRLVTLARRWVTFVLSPKGQAQLSNAGFTVPLGIASIP